MQICPTVATRFHLVDAGKLKTCLHGREDEAGVTVDICPAVATRFHLVVFGTAGTMTLRCRKR